MTSLTRDDRTRRRPEGVPVRRWGVTADLIDQANETLEKAAADHEPELLDAAAARDLLARCVKGRRVLDYLIASLTRKVHDPHEVARVTGTSMGKAKETVRTGEVLRQTPDLSLALQQGEVSLEQASEIAKAEESAPGAAKDLIGVAKSESFHVLKDAARKAKLEAEQHKGLAERQKAARSARSYSDALGMVNIHMRLQPHIGTPIVARAEAEAQRLYRAAKRKAKESGKDEIEPFERYLADAYAKGLSGGSITGPARRPELVVLVSHEVAKRGWTDVRPGEVCKIPGVGPVSPETAKEIAGDAFLNGVFCDGVDLRHFKRWSKHAPNEVAIALELGKAPEFDGVRCVDCGNRFRPEFDHVQPRAARGPSSLGNYDPRCNPCHEAKTARDRKAGLLKAKSADP